MDLRSIINTEAGDSSAQRQATPITPVQSGLPQRSFREQSHPPQISTTKHPSQDQGTQGPPYPSPTAYQGAYQGRPSAPSPLHPPSQNDRHSPVGTSHYSAQSPYQHQSIGGGQYPFPSQAPQSPAHPHPYPGPTQQRESYPQSNQHSPRIQHQNSYGQPSPTPNTPGGTHTYYHQRSQSSQSTSTPTSAQSQQPLYNQFLQDSPISASSFPQGQVPHQRQPSQPGTPLGPPLSNPRQSSGGFPQPTSPYQQRPRSSGMIIPPYSTTQVSPATQHPPHQRLPSTPSVPESHRASLDTPSRRSHSDREQSMSVSPKTQPQGLPRGDIAANELRADNSSTPTPKRKMDDEVDDSMSKPQVANGSQLVFVSATSTSGSTKKRMRYNEPPIWARSVTGRVKNNALIHAKRHVNGKQSMKTSSHQVKPEANGDRQMPSTVPKPPLQPLQDDYKADGTLGPWEPSITGTPPYEEISKLVADWLFVTVVNREDAGELASRGVEIEIEAKLGQLINKDTNERFYLPVRSECILADTGRVSFHSSMTEAQHKLLNDFLNDAVKETYPGNPNRTKPRVPVMYAHRRERDTFYELPRTAYATLPGCIRAVLNSRHTVKVRVTHDQKSGQLLAKIIKARVADLDIFSPLSRLDCRISVNLEMRYDGDVENLISATESSRIPDRNKDRLSYTHSHYQIDLTQVTVADPNSRTEKEHELEIELSAAAVREQGRRAAAGEPHQYAELVQGLIDNVRVLTRKVTHGTQL